MSFVSPLYLLFLVLVPAIVALYFRKSRPVRRVVPSDRLWEMVRQRLDANSLFQKYRHSLFLALQLAVVVSLVLGLARPYLSRSLVGRIVIFLDTSASMRATDVAPDRFSRARDKALSLVSRLDSDARVALVTGDSQVIVRAGFESEPSMVAALLRSLSATDHPGPDPDEVQTVLESLLRHRPDHVFVLTDQLKAADLGERIRNTALTVHTFGEGSENVALGRFELRPLGTAGGPRAPPGKAQGAGAARWEAELVVTNFAPGPVRTTVTLSQGKHTVASRPLAVGGRADARLHLTDLALQRGPVMAQVQASPGENLLCADDRAWASVGGGEATVLLVGRTGGSLARILRTVPGTKLVTLSSLEAMKISSFPPADVTVAEGVSHPDLYRRASLVFCSPVGSPPGDVVSSSSLALGGSPPIERPVLTRFESTHPLLKYLSFKDVHFESAAVLARQPGDVEVLGSAEGPLVLARNRGQVRQVVCAFTTDGNNFATRVSFPIFVVNCLRWIGGERMVGAGGLKLGDPFQMPSDLEGPIRIVDPEGKERVVEAPGSRSLAPHEFARAGLYTIRARGRELPLPAMLSHFEESAVAPAQRGDFKRDPASPGMVTAGPSGVAPWFLALALMVMVGEWVLFTRTGG